MSEQPRELLGEEAIRTRVRELAGEIDAAFAGGPVRVIAQVKGGLVFVADLMRALTVENTLHLMRCSTVEEDVAGEPAMRIRYEADYSFGGEDVLLVTDVVSTAITLNYLLETMKSHEPKRIRVCAIVDRQSERKLDLRPDWVLYTVPPEEDGFVVGYGLDLGERFRGLPYLGVIPRSDVGPST